MKLAEHIRANDLDACSHEFDLALSYMSNVSFNTAVTYFNHVMMSLLDDFSTTFTDDDTHTILMDKLKEIDRQLPNVCTYMGASAAWSSTSPFWHHQSINRKYGNEKTHRCRKGIHRQNYANPGSFPENACRHGRPFLRLLRQNSRHADRLFVPVKLPLSNTRMKKAEQLRVRLRCPSTKSAKPSAFRNTNYFYSIFQEKVWHDTARLAARVPAKRR